MIVFAGTVAVILISLILLGLVMKALDAFFEGERLRSVMLGGVAIVMFAALLALGVGSQNDPHANTLCLHGHEVWEGEYTAPILVGKVIVPGSRYEAKRWQCEQWESR